MPSSIPGPRKFLLTLTAGVIGIWPALAHAWMPAPAQPPGPATGTGGPTIISQAAGPGAPGDSASPAPPADQSGPANGAAPTSEPPSPESPGNGGPKPVESLAPVPPIPAPEETFIALPPPPEGTQWKPRRSKPLRTTVGIPPTASDLGSELDATSLGADTAGTDVLQTQNWSLNIRGYVRAPMRIGLGPADHTPISMLSGHELHSPPRMVGFSSSNWQYLAIAPNSSASLRTTISNPRVAATIILNTGTFPDVGYDDIDSLGGVTQGYVTLKFPEAFGSQGGLAWTVGAFSHSYGTAGPRQTNTGFYGTYLFGRTHVVGEDLTADIDLTDHVELLLEHGFGAKLDLIPFLGPALQKNMFIPGDPRMSLGTNFLHHAHAAIWIDDWLKIAGHYLTSWTPNDRSGANSDPHFNRDARLSATGAEVHFDHRRWGSGYLGFSHVWGHNLLPLDEALQVIHGGRGYDFKLQYFGNKLRQYGSTGFIPNDEGRVETVLFQYELRSFELFEYPRARRSVDLIMYAMFSHAYSPPTGDALMRPVPQLQGPFSVNDNKLKFGTQVEFWAFRHVSFKLRYDDVRPTNMDPGQDYRAYTASIVLRSDWRQNRQIIAGYTRFQLGPHCYPDSPYSTSSLQRLADPNLFLITAIMSL